MCVYFHKTHFLCVHFIYDLPTNNSTVCANHMHTAVYCFPLYYSVENVEMSSNWRHFQKSTYLFVWKASNRREFEHLSILISFFKQRCFTFYLPTLYFFFLCFIFLVEFYLYTGFRGFLFSVFVCDSLSQLFFYFLQFIIFYSFYFIYIFIRFETGTIANCFVCMFFSSQFFVMIAFFFL